MAPEQVHRGVAVIQAKRSQIGRMPGSLNSVEEITLLAAILGEAAKKADVRMIEGLIVGSSFPNERDNLARKALIAAGLPRTITASTISKTCASSDEALALAYTRILSGKADCMLVGGVEKADNSPYILKHMKQTIKNQMKGTLPLFKEIEARIEENDMTLIAERIALQHGITKEQQDDYVLSTIERARQAERMGYFKEEIIPIGSDGLIGSGSGKDEMLDTIRDEERIREAKPFYLKDGVLTQYTTVSVCECACAMLLMEPSKAESLGLSYDYLMKDTLTIGTEEENMGHAMSVCIEEILRQNQLTLSDIDLFEINESSAAQTIFTLQLLGLSTEKVNVNGGSLALGYPIGTTGMRMSVTLLHEMKRRNARLGLSVICSGGCMANATLFERRE